METMKDFIFLGSKITVDGDCSHEIKRCLLLESKAMTNLDSVLKSRAITLQTRVPVVKVMFFSSSHIQMWELDNKKGWYWRIDTFELLYWRTLLRVPWTTRRSNQSILKEIITEYSSEGLMLKLKLQYFGYLMWRADSLENTLILRKIEDRWRERQRMRWLDGITRLDGHEFVQIVKDREPWQSMRPWGCKESDTIEQLNNTNKNCTYPGIML